MKKKLILMVSILLMISLLAACNDDEKETDETEDTQQSLEFPTFEGKEEMSKIDTIAEYQGGTVSGEELAQYISVDAFMNPYAPVNNVDYQNDSLKYLVMVKAIGTEVEDSDWVQEKADELWERIITVFDEDTRQKGYDTLGISEEDVKNYAQNFYKVQEHFRGEVTDEDIEAFYETAKGSVTQATFRHILINTHEITAEGSLNEVRSEEEALDIVEEIQSKLDEGTSFNDLADEYNEDPGSAETSGLYENINVSTLEPNFAQAIMDQEINVIGEPVKTSYGYHIIQVEERESTPLDEIKDVVIENVAFNKSQEYLSMRVPGIITHVDESLVSKEEEE